jgi:hypothetical protein
MTEGLEKTLLHNIFGVLTIPGNPLRRGQRSPFVAGNQLLESSRIPALCGSYQCAVGVLVPARCTKRFHDQNPPRHLVNGHPEQSTEDARRRRRGKRSELIGRERDAPTQGCLGNLGLSVNCQSVGSASIERDERQIGRLAYVTDQALGQTTLLQNDFATDQDCHGLLY